MADPVTVSCPSACTVTLQVEVTTPLFNLSVEEGGQIASAILAVWAVAWGIRLLVRLIQTGGPSNESES